MLLTAPQHQHGANHDEREDDRSGTRECKATYEASLAFPRQVNVALSPATTKDHGPSPPPIADTSFMSTIGIRIATAMKPTIPPMSTIISGSSIAVSACTLFST